MQFSDLFNLRKAREGLRNIPLDRLPVEEVVTLWSKRDELRERAVKTISGRFPPFAKGMEVALGVEKDLLHRAGKAIEKAEAFPTPATRFLTLTRGLIEKRLERLEACPEKGETCQEPPPAETEAEAPSPSPQVKGRKRGRSRKKAE